MVNCRGSEGGVGSHFPVLFYEKSHSHLRFFQNSHSHFKRSMINQFITYRAKLLNADWLRQRAFFLNHDLEGTFGNQERAWLLDADWLSTPALGWLPALASNGFSETHRFCELRVWSKHGYFILSWKRINLQQSAVFWWKSKRIFPTKTVLIRSVWVGTTGVERSSWPPN